MSITITFTATATLRDDCVAVKAFANAESTGILWTFDKTERGYALALRTILAVEAGKALKPAAWGSPNPEMPSHWHNALSAGSVPQHDDILKQLGF